MRFRRTGLCKREAWPLTWRVSQAALAPRLVLRDDGHDVCRHASHGADLDAGHRLAQVVQGPQRRLWWQTPQRIHDLPMTGKLCRYAHKLLACFHGQTQVIAHKRR